MTRYWHNQPSTPNEILWFCAEKELHDNPMSNSVKDLTDFSTTRNARISYVDLVGCVLAIHRELAQDPLTQASLAKLSGMSTGPVGKIEMGRVTATVSHLYSLCHDGLKIKPSELLRQVDLHVDAIEKFSNLTVVARFDDVSVGDYWIEVLAAGHRIPRGFVFFTVLWGPAMWRLVSKGIEIASVAMLQAFTDPELTNRLESLGEETFESLAPRLWKDLVELTYTDTALREQVAFRRKAGHEATDDMVSELIDQLQTHLEPSNLVDSWIQQAKEAATRKKRRVSVTSVLGHKAKQLHADTPPSTDVNQ